MTLISGFILFSASRPKTAKKGLTAQETQKRSEMRNPRPIPLILLIYIFILYYTFNRSIDCKYPRPRVKNNVTP